MCALRQLIVICATTATLNACNIPFDFEEDGHETPFDAGGLAPQHTVAIVGFPWDKVDFRFKDEYRGYAGRLSVGDSIQVYFLEKPVSNAPLAQLDTVRNARWRASARSMEDPDLFDTTAVKTEPGTRGGAAMKMLKGGYWVYPQATVGNESWQPEVYSCNGQECVKVYIIVPKNSQQ